MEWVVIVLFAWVMSLSEAVPNEFLIQKWDTSGGLPHNTVRAIAQTPNGYLWLGTENGLARFDGVRFENFGRENTPVLQDPNVQFLQTDSGGTLCVGTGNRLYAWDAQSTRLRPDITTAIPPPPRPADLTPASAPRPAVVHFALAAHL
jgi:ligand-binding sensor domain-containing protein